MRRASQVGAGMTFCFPFAFIVRVFIGIAGHNILARFIFVNVPRNGGIFSLSSQFAKALKSVLISSAISPASESVWLISSRSNSR